MKWLVAVDGTEHSEETARFAEEMMAETPGAEVVVLYVSSARIPYLLQTPTGPMEYLPDHERARVDYVASHIGEWFGGLHKRVRFIHEVGQPAEVICLAARDENADIIVVGRHHRTLNWGSIADKVLSQADRPVLVRT